jgi:hypothetical protein
MTPGGPPDTKRLDFSQFHPLDHYLWQCTGYPGGHRRHLAYRWEFEWRHRLRSRTLCRLGRHSPVQWWRRYDGKSWSACAHCDKELA